MRKVVRAHNPGFLTIVNPKRKSTMVRRKRRNTRRRTTAAVNPRRRRRTVAAAPRRRRRVALAHNPHHRRRRRAVANPRRRVNRRRRNPSAKGIVMGGLWAGAGAAVTNIIAGYIPIGGGGWMDVVKQLAAAWVTGFIAERVPMIGGANAQLMAIGGFAGAAWSAVNMVLSGASGFLSPAPQVTGPGVSDIVAAPSFYPGGMHGLNGLDDVVPAPSFYPQQANGLY